MIPTKNLIILFSTFVLVIFLVLVFFFPSEEKRKKKKKKKALEKQISPEEKEWQDTAFKLKKHIEKLNQEINFLKIEQKKSFDQLKEEKQATAKLEEKLKREKKWFIEQEASLGQRTNDMRKLKMEMDRAQTEREKEYSLRLGSERETRELKKDIEEANKERKELLLKVMELEFQLKSQKEETAEFKAVNKQLLKEKAIEEKQWIAKAEFVKLEKILKEKEKEIKKLQEDRHR
ncbi:MAG: hypothetical protein PHY73_02345 [Candidatus Omnitrophica bacterium]|nr:hypothetical protein [Candidatus Omnitrophota bacterium]